MASAFGILFPEALVVGMQLQCMWGGSPSCSGVDGDGDFPILPMAYYGIVSVPFSTR